MKIKLEVFWAKCRDCETNFEVFAGTQLYGTRILRSKNTCKHAVVVCDSDPAFDEVSELVRGLLKYKNIPPYKKGEMFDQIFGKICDPAPDGSSYDMSGRIWCPKCHKSNVSYGPNEPPQSREVDLDEVTHKKWNSLQPNQKVQRIKELLSQLEV